MLIRFAVLAILVAACLAQVDQGQQQQGKTKATAPPAPPIQTKPPKTKTTPPPPAPPIQTKKPTPDTPEQQQQQQDQNQQQQQTKPTAPPAPPTQTKPSKTKTTPPAPPAPPIQTKKPTPDTPEQQQQQQDQNQQQQQTKPTAPPAPPIQTKPPKTKTTPPPPAPPIQTKKPTPDTPEQQQQQQDQNQQQQKPKPTAPPAPPTQTKPSKTKTTPTAPPAPPIQTKKPSKGGKQTPTIPDFTEAPPAAIDVCLQNVNFRNQKDFYPDVTECHHFYQCFYFNETYALGYRRRCPEGQFWHDAVLSCMPEGDVPCVDQCLEDAIAARGWYAGTGCRQYFFCSNTGSNGMCCPSGTEFNVATGACDLSESCADDCVPVAPAIPTTVAPAELFNSTVCQDSFGTYIYFDGSESNAYWLIDVEGHATEKQYCPDQVSFELDTCRCSLDSDAEAPAPVSKQQMIFYDAFNPTVDDVSVHRYKVFLYDGAFQDWTITLNPGRASLNVNGGRAEVPGLKSQNYGSRISIGCHFRCAGVSSCSTGAIMSNNRDADRSEYSFIAYVQAPNTLVVKFHFWAPVGAITLQGNFVTPSDSWNKFTAAYDGNTARLYINGAQVDSQNVGGYLSVAHSPLIIGNDASIGAFNGNLDTMFIAPWGFNYTDQLAHNNDDSAYFSAAGWRPDFWPPTL